MRLDLNLADPDGFYARLLDANEGLSGEQSEALVLRLVLLLANQVDDATLAACIGEAAKPFRTA